MRSSTAAFTMVAAFLSGSFLAGCLGEDGVVGPATAEEGPAEAASDLVLPYHWSGKSPVDAFVCGPAVGCRGHIVEPTEWQTDLPDEGTPTRVSLTLSWTPVDDAVGPMVFRLHRIAADGRWLEMLVDLKSDTSPVVMEWEGDAFAPAEYGRIAAWPAEKAAVGPVLVYVDLTEQPYDVDGTLVFA